MHTTKLPCRLAFVFVYERQYTHTHENSTHTGTNSRLSECRSRFSLDRKGWRRIELVAIATFVVIIIAKMFTSMDPHKYIYMYIYIPVTRTNQIRPLFMDIENSLPID